jgi:membrane protein DedA with SNARE-associated domain
VDPQGAIQFLESWGYPLFGLLLAATGIGSPIPEDLLLVAAGYLIAHGVFTWPATLPVAYCGVVASDCILYLIGTRIRTHSEPWARRFIRPERLDRFRSWFQRGHAAVLFARLVPGTRAVVFVGAGLNGIPFRRFLLFDAIGGAIWVPLVLIAGAQIGEEIGDLERLLSRITNVVWVLAAAVLILGIAWRFFRAEESKL